jgi:hypothetical protein
MGPLLRRHGMGGTSWPRGSMPEEGPKPATGEQLELIVQQESP